MKQFKLKSGYRDLATAVIKQWSLDGKPSKDYNAVCNWAKLLQLHSNNSSKTVKNGGFWF